MQMCDTFPCPRKGYSIMVRCWGTQERIHYRTPLKYEVEVTNDSIQGDFEIYIPILNEKVLVYI